MTDYRYYRDMLAERPELFRNIVGFNLDSAAEAAVHPPLPEGMRASGPLLRALHGVRPAVLHGWNDFSAEPARLAFLPEDTIRRLFLFFAASVYAEDIARLLDGRSVKALREAIGAEAYMFALRRGRYALGSLRPLLRLEDGPLAERITALSDAIPQILGAGAPGYPPLSRAQKTAAWHALKLFLLREVAPQWTPCFD